jgi:tetratricopeptide (TPR) repeat protein
MQHCEQCGQYNPDESIFCGRCSNRLNNRCIQCGYPNLMAQNFCGNCGKQLREDKSLPTPLAGFQSSLQTGGVATKTISTATTGEGQLLSPMSLSPVHEEDSDSGINTYALLSLEFANWDQSLVQAAEPQRLIQALTTQSEKLSSYLQNLGAQVGLSKKGVIFAAFVEASQVAESLQMALTACLPLLEEEFQFQNTWLKLRAGLDLEERDFRNPLTSGYERSNASGGTLMISERAFAHLEQSLVGDYLPEKKLYRLPAQTQNAELGAPTEWESEREEYSQAHLQAIWDTDNNNQNIAATLTSITEQEPQLTSVESTIPLPISVDVATEETGSSISHAISSFQKNEFLPVLESNEIALEGPTAFNEFSEPMEPLNAVETIVTFGQGSGRLSPAPLLNKTTVSEADQETADALSELFPHPMQSMEQALQGGSSNASLKSWPVSGEAAPLSLQNSSLNVQSIISPTVLPVMAPTPLLQSNPVQELTSTPTTNIADIRFQITFIPPSLGLFQTPRTINLRYGKAIDALHHELESFLGNSSESRNRSRIWSLCANDGMGKSNLIGMARMMVDPPSQRAIWLGGNNSRAFAEQLSPLGFWLDLLYNLLTSCAEGQDVSGARQKIQHFLTQAFEGQIPKDAEKTLLHFLSVERPQPMANLGTQPPNLLKSFFVQLLTTLCERLPVILVMEDVMFADAASLELLADLLKELPVQLPFGLILTHGRDFYPQNALLNGLRRHSYHELVLANLDETETIQFLEQGPLNGNLQALPATLTNALCRQSGGLPLWLEEALRLLYLRDVITIDPNTQQFQVQEGVLPSNLQLPDSLTNLVSERLEYLAEPVIYGLQLASVFGERFSIPLLGALAQMSSEEFSQVLDLLTSQGYILVEEAQIGRFRHGLLWQIIYQGIDFDLRVQMHQLVSETLENDFNQGHSVSPIILAHHSEAGQLPNRALQYWHIWGILLGQLGQITAMNMAIFHALDLLSQNNRQPLSQQELAIRSAEKLGTLNLEPNPHLAEKLLAWAYACREQASDEGRDIELLGLIAAASERQGHFEETLESLEKAFNKIDASDYPAEAASIEVSRADCLMTLGRLEEAKPLLAHLGSLQDPELAIQITRMKVQLLLEQNDSQAMIVIADAIAQAEKDGNTFGALLTLRLVQMAGHLQQGHYVLVTQQAERLLNDIERLDKEESDWFMAQWGLLALQYHLEMEDWTNVSQLVLTVIAKAENVRDYATMICAQIYSGIASAKLGKIEEGRRLLEESIEQAAEHKLAGVALIGWEALARFEIEQSNITIAFTLVTQALEVAEKANLRQIRAQVSFKLLYSELLLAEERWKEAGQRLEALWPQLAQAGWQPQIAYCAKLIGDLYSGLARQVPEDTSRKQKSIDFYKKAQAIWQHLNHPAQQVILNHCLARLGT